MKFDVERITSDLLGKMVAIHIADQETYYKFVERMDDMGLVRSSASLFKRHFMDHGVNSCVDLSDGWLRYGGKRLYEDIGFAMTEISEYIMEDQEIKASNLDILSLM